MGRVWGRHGGGWRGLAGLLAGVLLAGGVQAAPAVQEERHDIRIIIDVSGSMRHNDPDQLAGEALELLVDLLPDGTTAGIWTFGEYPANPLPLARVDEAWRKQARALSAELVDYQQFTDIEFALREAAATASSGRRHLVLLTDGVIDLPAWRGPKPHIDAASRAALLDEAAPLLAAQQTVVHAIAFSAAADGELVEQLAQQTGGLSATVATPEELLTAFLAIVDRIVPSDRVPLTEDRFLIEPGLEAFTALLFHGEEPPVLVAPDGQRYRADAPPAGASWRSTPRYDLVQVPSPMPGQWRVEGSLGSDSRVSVAPLHLRTARIPSTLYLGFGVPVEAWLADERGDVAPEDLPAYLSMYAELHDDRGAVQSRITLQQEAGHFVGELPAPALAGTARLLVRAEGQGFRRQRVQPVNVLPAIAARHEPAQREVVLKAEHPALNHDNTELYGLLQGGRLDARPEAPGQWRMALPELDESVSQPLLLRARILLEGQERELTLPRLLLFPEGATGLDRAEGPVRLGVERFHEELAPVREPREAAPRLPEGMERLIATIQHLPRAAQERWRMWRPPGASNGGHPAWLWALAAGLVLALVLVVLWQGRRRRRAVKREEPHV